MGYIYQEKNPDVISSPHSFSSVIRNFDFRLVPEIDRFETSTVSVFSYPNDRAIPDSLHAYIAVTQDINVDSSAQMNKLTVCYILTGFMLGAVKDLRFTIAPDSMSTRSAVALPCFECKTFTDVSFFFRCNKIRIAK